MSDLKALAQAVVEANRNNTTDALLAEHYSPECVSVEANEMPGMDRAAVGLDAIRGKHAWWDANAEMHSVTVTGPWTHGDNQFAVGFAMDVTMMGERTSSDEVGIYTVENGKIVKEEFFNPV